MVVFHFSHWLYKDLFAAKYSIPYQWMITKGEVLISKYQFLHIYLTNDVNEMQKETWSKD